MTDKPRYPLAQELRLLRRVRREAERFCEVPHLNADGTPHKAGIAAVKALRRRLHCLQTQPPGART